VSAKFSQLRELARQYSAGQVARDEYRRQRGVMLDEVATGKLKIDYRVITPPKPAAPPTVIIDVGDDEPVTRRVTIILSAIALVVAVGAGGFFYLRAQTAAPPQMTRVAPKAVAVAAIEEFLLSGDWSSAGTNAFEARWGSFTPEEQATARAHAAFGRLENELRLRIEDQGALAGLDSGGAAAAEAIRLKAFANRLGLHIQ
jgi:hypothetical protein